MELELRNGDYVPDGVGGLQSAGGREALLRRVLFRLTARRGSFPFWETLGSRLWQLGQVVPAERQAAAKQYVAEALAEETGLTVEQVELAESAGSAVLTASLIYEEKPMAVTLELSM
ncbi:hypothetical protein [uncultured Dysosmobacter sp.]|uniref:hypothetical protein n=1 Tax=uncultured Dysosmobacter sp. TaxID=2591384 RepID=UPI0026238ECE|nr:hypothetical protein [uncultured Dysosmobacter sp.]